MVLSFIRNYLLARLLYNYFKIYDRYHMSQLYLKFKNLIDFIRFITFSPAPFTHYINLDGHNIYFIQIAGLGERILYYVELDDKIEENYIIYNRFRDTLSFSSKLESDGQSVSIPILEVSKTNIFLDYPPK